MAARLTAFLGDQRIASGERDQVTRLVEERYDAADQQAIIAFDDATGRRVDLDYWDAGSGGSAGAAAPRRRPGRPKMGVIAREVTLLPRHWEWLARQSGGASATIRRLIEAASRSAPDPKGRRDAVYHFLNATCGDRPGYEAALRALYQGDRDRFADAVADWPVDLREYAGSLLAADSG
jgi:hypothetical protein